MVGAAQDEADLDVLLRDWSLTKGIFRKSIAPAARVAYGPRCICAVCVGPVASPMIPNASRHEAIVHLAGQIGIHPPVRLAVLPRQATDSAIRHRVRAYLGFVPFSADAEARLDGQPCRTCSLRPLGLSSWSNARKLSC